MAETEAVKREAYAALVHEVGDDPAFVAQIVDDYLTSSPRLIDSMREASRARQPTELGRLAHQLKSSSAWLGAAHLAGLCGEIEASARAGSILQDVDERIREIEAEARRVDYALRALAAQL
jgi:two-component system, sensor histidine kinase and response regulator